MKKILILLGLISCIQVFSQPGQYYLTPADAEVCGGTQRTYTINPQYWYPSLFDQYQWYVEGGTFDVNGDTELEVSDVFSRSVVVNWSNTPQSGDAKLRCEVGINGTEWIVEINPAIYAVPKPDQFDQADANGDIIVLTSSSSVALSTGSDSDWWIDDYKWVFDPVVGTTDTYFPSTESQTIQLDSYIENGVISVQSYNDHCDDLSTARTATIKRKYPSPTWNSSYTPPNVMCNYNTATIKINSVPNADYYTWETTGGIYINEQGSPTSKNTRSTELTIKAPSTGTGLGNVSVTAKRSGVLSSDALVKEIWVGKFNSAVTGEDEVCPFTMYEYIAQIPVGSASDYTYSWNYPSNWIYKFTSENSLHIKTPIENPDYGYVEVSITNICGSSTLSGMYVDLDPGCNGYYMMMPNPSQSYIDLDVDQSKISAFDVVTNNDVSLTIYDKMGTVVYSENVTSFPLRINTDKFQNGEYIATILTQEKVGMEKDQWIESILFIVNH